MIVSTNHRLFSSTNSDLLQCTNEPNVSIPQMANLLIERTCHSNWVVVFKSLITVHHLMCYGNEVIGQVDYRRTFLTTPCAALHPVPGVQ